MDAAPKWRIYSWSNCKETVSAYLQLVNKGYQDISMGGVKWRGKRTSKAEANAPSLLSSGARHHSCYS